MTDDVLDAAAKVAELERLAASLERLHPDDLRRDRNSQRIVNIVLSTAVLIVVIALIGLGVVVWTNRESLVILKRATGPRAVATQQATITDLKCDTRQAIGEDRAAHGEQPAPLKDGCPPYEVTITNPTTGVTQPTRVLASRTSRPAGRHTTVASTTPPSTSPPPTTTTTTTTTPPPSSPPSTCALAAPLVGCVVPA